MADKVQVQAEFFRNRVARNEKILRRWARKERVHAYRLYDRDIPEIPLALDWYRCDAAFEDPPQKDDALCLHLYDRPYEKDPAEEQAWLDAMGAAAAELLGVKTDQVFGRVRRRMRGLDQYEKLDSSDSGKSERTVLEGGLKFIVRLSDYLDTGLFLDHRPLRARVAAEARDRRVLNLFAYTGAFSVHAAAGGATRVDTVDLSNTYLAWAQDNLALNGFSGPAWPLHRADVPSYLESARQRGETWDLIIADPPTYSNSKASPRDFDVNRDWPGLIAACLGVLAPGGWLYFSSNSRRLPWRPEALGPGLEIAELGEASIPPDFRDKRIHRAFRIARAKT